MRLLTHNMLQCPRTKAYPLALEVLEAEEVELDYSREFIVRMAGRLNWTIFRSAAAPFTAVRLPVELPAADADDSVWRDVHRALLEWHVVRGVLRAPDGAVYHIKHGIPNLIIAEADQPSGVPDPAVIAGVKANAIESDDD